MIVFWINQLIFKARNNHISYLSWLFLVKKVKNFSLEFLEYAFSITNFELKVGIRKRFAHVDWLRALSVSDKVQSGSGYGRYGRLVLAWLGGVREPMGSGEVRPWFVPHDSESMRGTILNLNKSIIRTIVPFWLHKYLT